LLREDADAADAMALEPEEEEGLTSTYCDTAAKSVDDEDTVRFCFLAVVDEEDDIVEAVVLGGRKSSSAALRFNPTTPITMLGGSSLSTFMFKQSVKGNSIIVALIIVIM
jgi:hypothetical protein